MSNFKRVVIYGATGNVGSAIAKELLKKATFDVHILVRPESYQDETKKKRIDELTGLGAHLLRADLASEASLTDALRSVSAELVVSCVRGMALGLQVPLIHAAKAAGVRRFVPSDFCMDVDSGTVAFLNSNKKIHEEIRKSGLEWTYFNVEWFWDTTFLSWIGFDVAAGRVEVFGDGNNLLAGITFADAARFVAEVLNIAESRNATLTVLADTFTWNQAIELIERETGKKLEKVHIGVDQLKSLAFDTSRPELETMIDGCKYLFATAPVPKSDHHRLTPHLTFTSFAEWVRTGFKQTQGELEQQLAAQLKT